MSLGFKYHFSSADQALVITWVDPRGPAYEAAIQEGDKIISVDGMPTQQGDVLALLSKSAGDSIELVIAPKPRPGSMERALGTPLMGGVLYPQPPRPVTLTYRTLAEPNVFDHIQNFFTAPLPSPPPDVPSLSPRARCRNSRSSGFLRRRHGARSSTACCGIVEALGGPASAVHRYGLFATALHAASRAG